MKAVFSRDGKRLVTGSLDNTARVWDVDTALPASQPMRHPGPIWYSLGFSPDETAILTASDDRTARLWDIATSKPIGPVLVHETALRVAVFSLGRDSEILTGSAAGTTRLWDVPALPMEGEVERITVWLEATVGMELDPESGHVRMLDAASWEHRRDRLRQMGGPPDL